MGESLLYFAIGQIPLIVYVMYLLYCKYSVCLYRVVTSDSPVKGVLLVRNDLKMGKGKIVAQAMHAAYSAAKRPSALSSRWGQNGFKKVSLKVESEEHMKALLKEISRANIPFSKIIDAGRTQVEPNTLTVAFVGPWFEDQIDRITGSLPLL